MAEWYYINRGATDRRLALKIVGYKNNRQVFQARAVIFVLIYCSENQWYTQEQNRWYSKRTCSFTAVKGLSRHILALQIGLRYSTLPLTVRHSRFAR